jgi:hypothetical protein
MHGSCDVTAEDVKELHDELHIWAGQASLPKEDCCCNQACEEHTTATKGSSTALCSAVLYQKLLQDTCLNAACPCQHNRTGIVPMEFDLSCRMWSSDGAWLVMRRVTLAGP